MRLRHNQLKAVVVKARTTTKDSEGNTIVGYGTGIAIKADVYPASGKIQAEIYGEKLNYILNMIYDGNETINEGDGICVNTENPDYKVISKKVYGIVKKYEIEKL